MNLRPVGNKQDTQRERQHPQAVWPEFLFEEPRSKMRVGSSQEVGEYANVRSESDPRNGDTDDQPGRRQDLDDYQRPPPVPRKPDPVEAHSYEFWRPDRQHGVAKERHGEKGCGSPKNRYEQHVIVLGLS